VVQVAQVEKAAAAAAATACKACNAMYQHLAPLEQRLIAITRATPWFMAALVAVRATLHANLRANLRDTGLTPWCIGAGAVRTMVWDALQPSASARLAAIPTALPTLSDIDVAYFDADNLSQTQDAQLQAQLAARLPGMPWEVTNQAGVHQWFESYFGYPVRALQSLEDAVASWPEYASAVGLTLNADDTISVIAPHGLDDLFAMRIRRNPVRVSVQTYRQRIAQKQYASRWPGVTVVF
jgi:uncharacterized protein